ncbi:MAG: hypothetical protein IJ087_23050 [Eggerthellaceae bacterium]|nr:hypothetical protein [Eggerthellaceae bacterium]
MGDAQTITDCYNYGDVTGAKASGVAITNNGELVGCFNAGSITTVKSACGLAQTNKDLVENSYNVGSIVGEAAGGLVVDNKRFGVIANC